ncbi:MAG: hypothetical protein FWH33_00950 [Oscillospiraceae bacterium]|nr:hypothetical protein [Oscillospiraceae bacterium]
MPGIVDGTFPFVVPSIVCRRTKRASRRKRDMTKRASRRASYFYVKSATVFRLRSENLEERD